MKKLSTLLCMLAFVLTSVFAKAQTCGDIHGYPACDIVSPLAAYPLDSISIYDTIANATSTPINDYFFDVNTCNASIVLIDSQSFTDSLYSERVVLISQSTGKLNLRLSITAVWDTCTLNASCSTSATVVYQSNPNGKPLFAQVSPNTSHGNPNIYIKGVTGNGILKVYNSESQHLFSQPVQDGNTLIDMTVPGIYIYKIVDAKHTVTGKFVIL